MRLARRRPAGRLISLTPLVDVMLILLIFFMVTSSYLDLDMIPFSAGADAPLDGSASGSAQSGAADPGALLLRIGADGRVWFRGRAMSEAELTRALAARIAEAPRTPVLVLPSARARAQALVGVMEAAARAGAVNLRVVRLEAR